MNKLTNKQIITYGLFSIALIGLLVVLFRNENTVTTNIPVKDRKTGYVSTKTVFTGTVYTGTEIKNSLPKIESSLDTQPYYDFTQKEEYKTLLPTLRQNQINFSKSPQRDEFVNHLKNGGIDTLTLTESKVNIYIHYGSGSSKEKGNIKRVYDDLSRIKGISFSELGTQNMESLKSKLPIGEYNEGLNLIVLPINFISTVTSNENLKKYLYLIRFFDIHLFDLGNGYVGAIIP